MSPSGLGRAVSPTSRVDGSSRRPGVREQETGSVSGLTGTGPFKRDSVVRTHDTPNVCGSYLSVSVRPTTGPQTFEIITSVATPKININTLKEIFHLWKQFV